MTERSKQDLAEDLRWLARQWRAAGPATRARIEKAFKRGQEAARQ